MFEGGHLGFQLGDLPVYLTLSLERSNHTEPQAWKSFYNLQESRRVRIHGAERGTSRALT